MLEQLLLLGNAIPLSLALVFFILGLVFGSFSTVIWYRVPKGESIVWPGSHCPACGHALTPLELFPVLSFLWQRGRCRSCRTPISWRYPAIELLCGLLSALAAYTGGIFAGGGMLVLWVGGVTLAAERRKHSKGRGQDGFSLVEVAVAAGLLTALVVPMVDYGAFMRGVSAFPRQMETTLATAQLENIGSQVYRSTLSSWPPAVRMDEEQEAILGHWRFGWYSTQSAFAPTGATTREKELLAQYEVTVRCKEDCPRMVPKVRVVGTVVKIYGPPAK